MTDLDDLKYHIKLSGLSWSRRHAVIAASVH